MAYQWQARAAGSSAAFTNVVDGTDIAGARAAATGQAQTRWTSAQVHSAAVNRPDQIRPGTICDPHMLNGIVCADRHDDR